jgi:hypothetical protein
VVFENGSYLDYNFSGCFANALGDTSPTGCGAAAALYDDCAHLACRGCKPIQSQADYSRYYACFKEPGVATVCVSELASFNAKCGDYFSPSPSNPVEICQRGVPELIALFCTALPDGGDDAGDAGD